MIISVHIPKTGGVTFREILRDTYKEKIFFDYTPWKKEMAVPEVPEHIEIIHGHIRTEKYIGVFPDAQLITWLRNPIDIPVSMYYYFKRSPDFKNPLCKALYDDDLSLNDFLLLRKNWNTIATYLGKVKITDFAFVGVLEHYAASMELFKKISGLETLEVDTETKKNVNPNKGKDGYELDAEILAHVQASCRRDCEIYEVGLEYFKTLCKKNDVIL